MNDRISTSGHEALCESAVAMLDPLMAARDGWVDELASRLVPCARHARNLGLTAFAELAEHVSQRLPQTNANEASREAASRWVAGVVEYCSAQLSPDRVAQLSEPLVNWSDELSTDLPYSEDGTLGSLHRLLASQLATLADGSDPGLDCDGLQSRLVARDELKMLAEACQEIEHRCQQTLERAGNQLSVRRFCRVMESVGDDLARLTDALRALGLGESSRIFQLLAERLEPAHWRRQGASQPVLESLMALAQAWRYWFGDPVHPALERAIEATDDAWSAIGDPSTHEDRYFEYRAIAKTQFASIDLVGSRQLPRDARDEAISSDLVIPADIDPQVQEQLLTELPALADALVQSAIATGQGRIEQLAAMQRLAHTVKGAANTVGITGLGQYAHALEDLLNLLGSQNSHALPAVDNELLGEAVDCLANMTDALIDKSPAPVNMQTIYQAIVDRAKSLATQHDDVPPTADDPVADTFGESGHSGTSLDISDFDLPDLDLDSPAAPVPAIDEEPDGSDTGKPSADPAAAETAPQTQAGRQTSATPVAPVSSAPTASTVSTDVIDQVLETASEAMIVLSQVNETLERMGATQSQSRLDSERLVRLAVELDRHIDATVSDGAPRGTAKDAAQPERLGELHAVSRRISEVGADGKVRDQAFAEHYSRMRELVARLGRLQTQIRQDALSARMVPASSISARLQRAARQAARMAGKQATLTMSGGATAVDADLLQRLVQPLSHLIRNAIDHGIETPAQRDHRGKDIAGAIALTLARESSNLRVVVQDDGCGLDVPAIQSKARSLGLLPPDGTVDAKAASMLIQAPGFSTRAKASQLSGRGLGLDVVSQLVRAMKGRIDIESEDGLGTCVTLTIPMQMTMQSVFVMRLPTHVLALSVRGVEQILSGSESVQFTSGGMRLDHDGRLLEVRRLDQALGLPAGLFSTAAHGGAMDADDQMVVLVQTAGGGLTGLLLPALGHTQPVVVRRLPTAIPHVAGIDGVAVLGDGAVAPVIDLPELVATSAHQPADAGLAAGTVLTGAQESLGCLIVDDSVSVRRAMAQLVEDIGLPVSMARDASEALTQMEQQMPALILTDLEMPGMNGFDFIRQVRADAAGATVPVIMITSRDSPQLRAQAEQAGVNAFLTKPVTESKLSQVIGDLLDAAG